MYLSTSCRTVNIIDRIVLKGNKNLEKKLSQMKVHVLRISKIIVVIVVKITPFDTGPPPSWKIRMKSRLWRSIIQGARRKLDCMKESDNESFLELQIDSDGARPIYARFT